MVPYDLPYERMIIPNGLLSWSDTCDPGRLGLTCISPSIVCSVSWVSDEVGGFQG